MRKKCLNSNVNFDKACFIYNLKLWINFLILEKCSDPRRNTNAVVSGRKFYHGEQVRFYCARRDYVLVPPQSATLTCEDGKWKGTIPSCKGKFINGYFYYSHVTFNLSNLIQDGRKLASFTYTLMIFINM